MAGLPTDRIVFFLILMVFSLPWAFAAFKGLKTGKLPGKGGYILRGESPRLFRLGVITWSAFAVVFFFWGVAILIGVIPLGPPTR